MNLQTVQSLHTLPAKDYYQVAESIELYVRQKRLLPGSKLPSERILAKRFGVTHGMVRLANNLLEERGLVRREHGKGTFLTQWKQTHKRLHRRIGVLIVDRPDDPRGNSYYQNLTAGIQAAAHQCEFEVIFDQLKTEEMLRGRFPRMLADRTVDAVVLDGRVRSHHVSYLRDQGFLSICTGDTPLGWDSPQIRFNMEQFGQSLVKPLLDAGRSPIWLDADPTNSDYFSGQELFRGYAAAMQGDPRGNGTLHLCSIEEDSAEEVARLLLARDIERAALITQSPYWPLVFEHLKRLTPIAEKIWFVPLPMEHLVFPSLSPNCARWREVLDIAEAATLTVSRLLELLEGRNDIFRSVSIEFDCQVAQTTPHLELALELRHEDPVHAFTLYHYANGSAWQQTTTPAAPRN